MSSFSVFVLLLAVFLAVVSALPSLSPVQVQGETFPKEFEDSRPESTLEDLIVEDESAEPGDRFRRVTCDILSVHTKWLSFNHAPCAIRCIAKRKGYRGGACWGGVCHCRRGHH